MKKKRDYSKTKRTRTNCIQVRVTEEENSKIHRNAKAAGLNVSTYVRKLALLHDIKAIPPEAFYETLDYLKFVKAHLGENTGWYFGKKELKEFTAIYENFEKTVDNFYYGDADGNH